MRDSRCSILDGNGVPIQSEKGEVGSANPRQSNLYINHKDSKARSRMDLFTKYMRLSDLIRVNPG